MYCKNCGHEIDPSVEICAYCGAKTEMADRPYAKRFCTHCGQEIDPNAEICIHCGVRVGTPYRSSAQRKRFCTHCGQEIDPNAEICVHCGVRVARPSANIRNSSAMTLAIISFICSLLTFTLAGAILAIVGTLKAIQYKQFKELRLNFGALICCFIVCIAVLVL